MNVQLHCDFCNKTLADIGNNGRPEGQQIELWTVEPDGLYGRGPFSPGYHAFCDWRCVSMWSQNGGRAGIVP